MRILGIDPGTAITGFAVIDSNAATSNSKPLVRDCGSIRTTAESSPAARLAHIANDLEELLTHWHPDEVAIEKLFFATNVTTAVSVAQARGVILQTIERHHLPSFEYAPREIKQAICGAGGADKKAVQKMVQLICALAHPPRNDDAADALAVALAHAQTIPLRRAAQSSPQVNAQATPLSIA